MYRTLPLWLVPLLALPSALRADDKPRTPAETLQAIQQEQKKGQEKFYKAYEAAKTNEQQQKLVDAWQKGNQDCARRALELAREHPKDPAAFQALQWITTGGIGFSPVTADALELIRRDYIKDKRLEPIVNMGHLYWSVYGGAEDFLREAAAKNPNRDVQARALLSLAQLLQEDAEAARAVRGNPALVSGWERQRFPKEFIKKWQTTAPEKFAKQAEDVYQRVIDQYADVKPLHGKQTLGQRAEAALFEMRHLQIGKKAPDITGQDIDGKRFQLSDYRGKVVLLDFWGNW